MSFLGLFGQTSDPLEPPIRAVSIPIIQRDYAQGRVSAEAQRIRERFLLALHESLTEGRPRTLDFVYGEVQNGRLVPLDGQQRLTTLFLLHVYVAARAAEPLGLPVTAFTYETRPAARLFCQRLIEHAPAWATSGHRPRAWLEDQPWFALSWARDPTVAGMCTMLEAIADRFDTDDPHMLWARLRDPEMLNFYFLGLTDLGLTDNLYIAMNARGRPLTPFENVKGRLEKLLKAVDEGLCRVFEQRVDTAWASMLWYCAGADRLVDEQFLRYLAFLTEVRGRLMGVDAVGTKVEHLSDTVERLALPVFGTPGVECRENLAFMIAAFDCWCSGPAPKAVFDGIFKLNVHERGKVTLYGKFDGATVDLLKACAATYALADGRRVFALKYTLLLYAVLVHRIEGTEDFSARLRAVRNLGEHTRLEAKDLGGLLKDVGTVVRRGAGALNEESSFSSRQVGEEAKKAQIRETHKDLSPLLDELEDHPLLRGCLAVFDLDDPVRLERRARTFLALMLPERWPLIWRALVASGDFSTKVSNVAGDNRFRLSVPDERAWSASTESVEPLLTGARVERMRGVLATLLDAVGPDATDAELADRVAGFVSAAEAGGGFDWRVYLLKYPLMLPMNKDNGFYVGLNGTMGFSLCKLRTEYTGGYYRDPYLVAVARADAAFEGRTRGAVWTDFSHPWHTGDERQPRWLTLRGSGTRLRFELTGVVVAPPLEAAEVSEAGARAVQSVREPEARAGGELLFRVAQTTRDGVLVDSEDRILLGIALLRALISAESP